MFLLSPAVLTRLPVPTTRAVLVLQSSAPSRDFARRKGYYRGLCARHSHSQATASISHFSILTKSSAELIRRLNAADAKLGGKFSENVSVALLFTPPFAHLLGDGSRFLESVLSSSFRGVERGTRVDALVAVVDAIPIADTGKEAFEEAYQDGAGTDGMTVCLINNGESESLWNEQLPQASRVEDHSSAYLSIHIDTPIRDGVEPSIDMHYQVTLPLPNTVFENGKLHTLTAVSYDVDNIGPDHVPQMKLRDSRRLHNFPLRIESGKVRALAGPTGAEDTLRPLTQFRRIVECMGNIVRRLEGSGSEDGAVTASYELEASLKQWKERPFEIWAEIIPREQWQNNPSDIDGLPFISRLEQGHRFARILSGGGGWGVRAGLLSLDPETIPYESPDRSTRNSASELPFTLPELVREGDFIRYLLAPRPVPDNLEDTSITVKGLASKFPAPAVYEFGSGLRNEGDDEEAPASEPKAAVLTATFGALSRKPASIEIRQTITRNAPSTTRQQKALVQTHLPPRATIGFG